jgi:hypothetical protein
MLRLPRSVQSCAALHVCRVAPSVCISVRSCRPRLSSLRPAANFPPGDRALQFSSSERSGAEGAFRPAVARITCIRVCVWVCVYVYTSHADRESVKRANRVFPEPRGTAGENFPLFDGSHCDAPAPIARLPLGNVTCGFVIAQNFYTRCGYVG